MNEPAIDPALVDVIVTQRRAAHFKKALKQSWELAVIPPLLAVGSAVYGDTVLRWILAAIVVVLSGYAFLMTALWHEAMDGWQRALEEWRSLANGNEADE